MKGKPIRKTQGKLIVFEGADGTGKTTQAKLLYKYLQKKKIPAVLTSFPRYDSAWGKMIRRYLDGEFGSTASVSPYLASLIYAGDRFLAKDQIKKWIDSGNFVICDRYVASNIAHQGAKISDKTKKEKFINWIEELEYRENQIPKEDLVILLTMPGNVAQKLMRGRVKDIHEQDSSYQARVANIFEELVEKRPNWVAVSNMEGSELRSFEDVHREIVGVLRKSNLIFE